jgi:beta-mannosidase
MKNQNIITTVIFIFLSLTNLFSQPIDMEINQNWKFHQIGKSEWYPAKVPGCVHTDLLDNTIIQDPFFRTNEKDLQWIDKDDWEYKTSFNIDKNLYSNKNIELIFYGLDTYADVYLNEQKILSADNMFREWKVECKELLNEGANNLRIYFHSPVKVDVPKLEKLGYNLPAVNDLSELGGLGDKCISVFARKAPYHYGWDWGPRFVTSGIWRPIIIRAWQDINIKNVQIIQNSLTKKLAALTANIEVKSTIDDYADLNIISDNKNVVKKKVKLIKGQNKISTSFEIENPKYWWPNRAGEAFLYNLEISLNSSGKILDEKIQTFGLRNIEVVQDEESVGRSFYLKVNGKPVFMKGANYIPSDNFLNRVTPADYEAIIKSAADANMNMLRVWGGGIYENDIFYDLCDKYGILLWQDFMFACSMYPGDEHFLKNVKQEAIDNVKRLRNHPSIALWCGNNEIQDGWEYWGWKPKFTEEQQKEVYNAYTELFLNIIPSICKEFDGTRLYWPSSPSSDYGRASKTESGDIHDWSVWHGKEPFEKYKDRVGRFVSEYGFQSLPEFKTVKAYTIPEDWDIESPVMMAHQRSGYGNLRIRDYLEMYYKKPKDFQSFLYVSQVQQAFGVKQGIEAHRRARPFCMGTLYWQIDDCWPVASWSSMDYYKRWKALHYAAKKAYEPIIISPVIKNDTLVFYIVSDKFEQLKAEFLITVIDFDGKEVYNKSIQVKVKANGSKSYLKIKKEELIGSSDEGKIIVVSQLKNDKEIFAENIFYFYTPKDLNLEKPNIKMNVAKNDNGYSIELSTDKLAKDVYLSIDEDGSFTDNYFDLIPGIVKKIELKTKKEIENLENKIKVISLVDSF